MLLHLHRYRIYMQKENFGLKYYTLFFNSKNYGPLYTYTRTCKDIYIYRIWLSVETPVAKKTISFRV